MAITIEALDNSFRLMRTDLRNLKTQTEDLEDKLAIYVTKAEMSTYLSDMTQSIAEVNTALETVEEKISNILLPDDTRFYLKESEITDFRDNFKKLRALISDVEKSRQSMIRLLAKANLTGST